MRKPKRIFLVPALVLAGTSLLFRFMLFVGYVPTESMEPTLHKGCFIVGSRIFGELEVGDIVVFQHEGKLLVKRIAEIKGNSYYMLGDNTEDSYDSRYWDQPFIPKKDIIAQLGCNF